MMSCAGKKVLLLGAGLVSAPCVQYLTEHGVSVTIASAIQKELDDLVERYNNTTSVQVDICENPELVLELISDHGLTISLLPYQYHPQVAEMCIRKGKSMVNASYQSAELQEMDQRAKDAGVLILSEVGLDPGIDHFLAMKCIREAEGSGGRVVSFQSWCGGIPAPQFADNPLKYKFSWSPKTALEAVEREAKWLEHGEVKEVAQGTELPSNLRSVDVSGGFQLEGFPNRDSTMYKNIYGLEHAHSVLRGTLRYRGFSDAAKALVKLGLICPSARASLQSDSPPITWKELICGIIGADVQSSQAEVSARLLDYFDGDQNQLQCITGLQLLSDEVIEKKGSCIDTLSCYLGRRLAYGDGEIDMTVMRHNIGVVNADDKLCTHVVELIVYGDENGYSAMSKTVGYPVGTITRMILEGKITNKGVILPLTPDIYLPVLEELKGMGIIATESVTN